MAIHIPLSVKYRPKKLSEVIGQKVVVQAITNAFKSNTMHHAYILSGSFGLGKTSIGRIMAAMENCINAPTLNPCGKCDNCRDIFEGKSIDVVELDAASNRGIDDIRQLKEDIKVHPIYGRVKYILIDEAHSLGSHAAEAALKMIEEPPLNVKFIFCTTNSHKIIETIHSRCILFNFNKINWLCLYEHIKKIADKEDLDYEDEALKIAAKYSKGSVRNALQNLQTLVNYAGENKITIDTAKDILGALDNNIYFKLIDAIIKNCIPESFAFVDKLLIEGRDIEIILSKYYEHLDNILRMIYLINEDEKELFKMGYTTEDIKKYNYQIKTLGDNSSSIIIRFINLLSKVNAGIELNIDPQVLLHQHIVESAITYQFLKKKENK